MLHLYSFRLCAVTHVMCLYIRKRFSIECLSSVVMFFTVHYLSYDTAVILPSPNLLKHNVPLSRDIKDIKQIKTCHTHTNKHFQFSKFFLCHCSDLYLYYSKCIRINQYLLYIIFLDKKKCRDAVHTVLHVSSCI